MYLIFSLLAATFVLWWYPLQTDWTQTMPNSWSKLFDTDGIPVDQDKDFMSVKL